MEHTNVSGQREKRKYIGAKMLTLPPTTTCCSYTTPQKIYLLLTSICEKKQAWQIQARIKLCLTTGN